MSAKPFSRHKVSRRFGVDVYGTGGPSLERRLNVPPGGLRARKGKPSDYALQLREKQKVKALYGIRENQFRRYFREAERSVGQAGSVLLQICERRLDNVIYRLGFARTRLMARQLVNHAHVRVDGNGVNIPSYQLRPGQTVSLTDAAMDIADVRAEMELPRTVPAWLERYNGSGKMKAVPAREEIHEDIDEILIVGFYAR